MTIYKDISLYLVKQWLKIEDRNLLETFLRWVRTSANFFEVPWLSFEPKVSKLPGTWNNSVSSTFLTAESSNIRLSDAKITHIFFCQLIQKKFIHI